MASNSDEERKGMDISYLLRAVDEVTRPKGGEPPGKRRLMEDAGHADKWLKRYERARRNSSWEMSELYHNREYSRIIWYTVTLPRQVKGTLVVTATVEAPVLDFDGNEVAKQSGYRLSQDLAFSAPSDELRFTLTGETINFYAKPEYVPTKPRKNVQRAILSVTLEAEGTKVAVYKPLYSNVATIVSRKKQNRVYSPKPGTKPRKKRTFSSLPIASPAASASQPIEEPVKPLTEAAVVQEEEPASNVFTMPDSLLPIPTSLTELPVEKINDEDVEEALMAVEEMVKADYAAGLPSQ